MIDAPDSPPAEYAIQARPATRLSDQVGRILYWARRYWWIAALTIMIAMGVVDYLALREPTRYMSVARMMVSGRVSLPQGDAYTEGSELANFYGTQVALMKSQQIVNQASDRVSTIHPEVTPDPEADVDAGIELRTSIFDLKVTSVDPEYARLLLDGVMDMYLSSKREWKNQTTDEAVSAITEEISHLDAEIRTDEQQLLDFQKQNNVVFIEDQSNSAATYLDNLNKEQALLTKERDLLELESKDPLATPVDSDTEPAVETGKLPGTDSSIESGIPGTGVNHDTTAILAEQDRIEKLKILRDQFGINLKDAHPKMKELAETIDKEQKFLDLLKSRNVKTRQQHREDLDLQITNLGQQIITWNDKSLQLSQRLATYQDLKNKITREQALYDQLAASIQNVDLTKSLDQEDVVIMEAASKAIPLTPNYLLRLLYAFLSGLAIGTAIIYAVVRLDDKIDSPLDIEEDLHFPMLGQIPLVSLDRKTKRVPLLDGDDLRHDFLEHHRDIRSALMFGSATRPRSLMISSAAPGEGKSTMAANLAVVFAQGGTRVLLIDADLRRGVLHGTFGLPVTPGLSDHLRGEIPWHKIVQNTAIPNLDFIPRGKVPTHAGDLLLSAATEALVQETAAEYDLVLWDTAPLFAAHDAANLCSKVDGILFMARVRHSSINLVKSALEDLARRKANILGIVLNAVKPGQPGYYDKYRYKEYQSAVAHV